jgi:hypothetical protein
MSFFSENYDFENRGGTRLQKKFFCFFTSIKLYLAASFSGI